MGEKGFYGILESLGCCGVWVGGGLGIGGEKILLFMELRKELYENVNMRNGILHEIYKLLV